ncbi:MAG TPA: dockerin type I domain-containing protein, partial [Gemmataceae bacterium]
ITWSAPGRARVDLTSFRADFTPANGMLFVSPNSSDNNANIIAALPNGNGWDIAVREDNSTDTTGNTFTAMADSEFQFMYVDYRYAGVIGAQINGGTGATTHGAGSFTLTRLGTGTYGLTIPGKVDTSGTLMLTVAGAQAGSPTLPSRSFLSYQFDAANNRFVIQARQLTTGSNPFGQDSVLTDTDFDFAWVDYANAMRPALPPTVQAVQVDAGGLQRSSVRSMTVTFDSPVTFPSGAAAAFQLTRTGPTGPTGTVALTPTVSTDAQGRTVVVLTFSGQFAETNTATGVNPSLVDGKYTLTINSAAVTGAGGVALDGNNDGTSGGDYTLATHRLFGDVDGDGDVDLLDLNPLVPALFGVVGQPNYNPAFDFEGDGDVDLLDLNQFVQRLFLSGYTP